MAAGDRIATRTGVAFLHVARGEDALLLDEHDAEAITPRLISPGARDDQLGRVDEILVALVADHAVHALRGVAADRQRAVDEEVQPIEGLLDARAALGPDGAGVLAVRKDLLHGVGDLGERAARRIGGEVIRPVGEEVATHHFGRIALLVAGGGRDAKEVDLGARSDQARFAVAVDAEAVDLLEEPRAVGIERLARALGRRHRLGAVVVPGPAIGLARHVRKRIEAVARLERHFVNRDIVGARPAALEIARPVEVAVGRRVQLGGVALERMGAELLDIDLDRGGEALRPEGIEGERLAAFVAQQRQPMARSRLVAGDERRCIGDRRVRTGDMGDARLHAGIL